MLSRRRTFAFLSLLTAMALSASGYRNAQARATPRGITFRDNEGFDDELGDCMREGFEVIEVMFPSPFEQLPERLRSWLKSVDWNGNEIRVRDVTPKSRGIWLYLLGFVVEAVGQWVTTSLIPSLNPAKDYHAVIVAEGWSPESAKLLKLEFYKRGSQSWAEAHGQTVPLRKA